MILAKNNTLAAQGYNEHTQKTALFEKTTLMLSSRKNSSEKLRIAIVDDEPLARRAIRRVVENCPNVDTVAECSDGSEAVKMLQEVQPDLIFLDIEMPRLNGFEVIEHLKPHHIPFIVFVTAHQEYALDAFKVHAIDYLVKPIREERIEEVLQRALYQVQQNRFREIDSRLDSILQLMGTQEKESHRIVSLERITIKNNGRIYFVETASIDWIGADGNYVTLHTGKISHLLRIKMNQLEGRLDARMFFRIHRSTIVNIRSIKELRPYFNGAFMILLRDDTKIYSSRGYHDRVDQIMNQLS
jgi:two-component system, LytTR family, response regulator